MKKKSITVRNATLADVQGIVEVAAKADSGDSGDT